MATYNSAQDGNFSADATWTESGHPNANDDVAIIAHAVDYDIGDSSITWNNVTINSGGILDFPINSDSSIVFNTTGILTINDGGKLSCGSEANPLGKAYKLNFYWPQGTTNRDTLVLNDGGEIALYGDPGYYGSEKYADLDSDWSAGQTLYIAGDFSSKWQAGQKFYIHQNILYSSYLTDANIFTIASVGGYDSGNDRTPITISESAPGVTFTSICEGFQSQLIMVSRNIELADPGSSWDIGSFISYAERISFDNNQGASNNLIDIREAVFRGWDYAIDGGYNFLGDNLIFISNSRGIYSGTNHQITGDFISNYRGIESGTNHQITSDFISNYRGIDSGTNHQITGDFISNSRGIDSGTNHQITSDFISNYNGIYSGTNHQITSDFISNYNGIYSGTNHQITGDFISNYNGIYSGTNHQITGDFISNYNGIYSGTNHQITGDFLDNTTNVNLASNGNKYSAILEDCLMESTDRQPIRIYESAGNWLPLVSGDTNWQTPTSSNDWILEAIPNSYCKDSYCNQLELSPLNPMGQYVTSGSKTLTYKIYPVGWTTALDNDDIVLEVQYLDSASGITRTTILNTTTIYDNNAWRDLSVTFNPSQGGIIYFQVYFKKYESGCYIVIDPEPVIA